MPGTGSGVRKGWFRLTLGLTTVVLLLPAAAFAQHSVRTAGFAPLAPPLQVHQTLAFDVADLEFGRYGGFDTVHLGNGEYVREPGRPLLPKQTVRVAVPPGMAVERVRVLAVTTEELPGRYIILPAQPPRRWSQQVNDADFVPPDPQAYAATDPYPAQVAEFGYQADLAGQAFAVVTVYPLQYVAAEGRLRVHTSIILALEGREGYECGDYLPAAVSEQTRARYRRMVEALVVNPEDVALQAAPPRQPRTYGVGPGNYEYVIITQPDWISVFQPLADWRTKKGMPAAIVDRDWIYSEYPGDTNVDKIQAFVIDAHSTWGATFFLLGGDTDSIPYHVKTILQEDIPNDTYYADYDGDWVCEVHVGRCPVRQSDGVDRFLTKLFTYAREAPPSNFGKLAFFCGFDAEYPGSGEGEMVKEAIRSRFLPADWTLNREYDSEPGSHKADVIAYLNQGHNLVNHIDHCSDTTLGVGTINHGDVLTKPEVNALTNGDRPCIFYTVGCHPADYTVDGCIGEAFVRNGDGGGIAFIGNTRDGFYVPGSDDGLSHRYDRRFFRSLFWQDHYYLGDCFSDHKNDSVTTDPWMRYIFTELTLLGDPAVPIWTDDPQTLTVTHDATLIAGQANTFPVTVYSGGSPLEAATVCLWKPGDVYEIQQTNPSGVATFSVTPATVGTMYVTASYRDHYVYEGQAEVIEGSGETVLPDSYTIVHGRRVSGDLSDLFYSDDSRLVLTHSGFYPPWIELEVVGTAPEAAPVQLTFVCESLTTGELVRQEISMYDYVGQVWEQVDVSTMQNSDQVVEVVPPGDPARFIDPGTLEMKTRIKIVGMGFTELYGWNGELDQTVWTVTP